MKSGDRPRRTPRHAPGALPARRAQLQARQRRHDRLVRARRALDTGLPSVTVRLLGLDLELGTDPRRALAVGEGFWALVRTRRYGVRLARVLTKDRGATTIYLTATDWRELGAGEPDVFAYVTRAWAAGRELDGVTLDPLARTVPSPRVPSPRTRGGGAAPSSTRFPTPRACSPSTSSETPMSTPTPPPVEPLPSDPLDGLLPDFDGHVPQNERGPLTAGPGGAVVPQDALPPCEVCGGTSVHGEHDYDRFRAWCAPHTPWSGHFDACGPQCRADASEAPPPPASQGNFRALCAAVVRTPAMFGATPSHVESVLYGAWYVAGTRAPGAWPELLAGCDLLRGNRSGVREFLDVVRLARYLLVTAVTAASPAEPERSPTR